MKPALLRGRATLSCYACAPSCSSSIWIAFRVGVQQREMPAPSRYGHYRLCRRLVSAFCPRTRASCGSPRSASFARAGRTARYMPLRICCLAARNEGNHCNCGHWPHRSAPSRSRSGLVCPHKGSRRTSRALVVEGVFGPVVADVDDRVAMPRTCNHRARCVCHRPPDRCRASQYEAGALERLVVYVLALVRICPDVILARPSRPRSSATTRPLAFSHGSRRGKRGW